MNTLEYRYWVLIYLLPKSYREARGEEMLGTLMDGAKEGQQWPRLGEALSLGRLALRTHLGLPDADSTSSAYGFALRAIALSGTFWLALRGIAEIVAAITDPHHLLSSREDAGVQYHRMLIGNFVMPIGWLLLFLMLLVGLRRTGRLLAVVLAAATLYAPAGWIPVWNLGIDSFARDEMPFIAVTVLAVVLSFGRTSPAVTGRRWWLAGFAIYGAAAALAFEVQSLQVLTAYVLTVVVVIAVLVAVHVYRSPQWPIGLAVLGFLLLIQQQSRDYSYHVATTQYPEQVGLELTAVAVQVGLVLLCAAIYAVLLSQFLAAARRGYAPVASATSDTGSGSESQSIA